ncbi:sodium:proton antiporter [Arthrobacter sp. MYb224]|uniref:monovalent cation/H(+) antiporter subunit G n=1 Tax=Arthrobacter sp. MYb224 TaxID=1848600 RepID=UPI000CFB5362|nr:monovalent cation/H(+) antiporter subunit G [Arthrobacter sp. MYb224]PQZ99621.1 sodium:proton antiporter [Arthrobacter sp. MYb224]
MDTFLEALAALLLVLGSLMSLIAGIGLITFPDLLSRMHAATKPQVLGFLLLFAGLIIHLRSWGLIPVFVLAWGLQLLTAPVSAHMIGRAGYRTKHVAKETLHVDELKQVISNHSQTTGTTAAVPPAKPAQNDEPEST